MFDHFLEHGIPPVLEEVATHFNLRRARALEFLMRLDAERHLKLLPGTSRILMAFPFSAIATPYRVTRENGVRYFANCAWDAVAFHPMLGEDLRIDSFCHDCGEPVRFGLKEGRGIGSGAHLSLVYLGLPVAAWWTDIISTCSNQMVFFGSERHLNRWRSEDPRRTGESLTIDQTVQLSDPIYRKKLEAGYVRPSKDELASHFSSLGLTSEFWKL